MKILENIKKNKFLILLIAIFLVGTFLRFYKLEEFLTFLGDEGRDAIVFKRILSLEHFPAIGAPSSIGQVYLGPFYYYFIAPWLAFFNYNPVGPAMGVALFSSLYIIINYFIVEKLLNKKIAIISSSLIAFSSTLVNYSRFSWNPNLLPLFTLLTIFFLIKSVETKKNIYFLLSGTFLSLCIQLHYLALLLLIPSGIYLVLHLKTFNNFKRMFFKLFLTFWSFLFFSFPLIFFDLRHQFINSKKFIALFTGSNSVISNKLIDIFSTFNLLNKFSFNINLPEFINILILIFFICLSFYLIIKQKKDIYVFSLFFIIYFIGISLFSGQRIPHYFIIAYPLYFIIISYLFSFLKGKSNIFIFIFILFFIFFNSRQYLFLYGKGPFLINKAEKVAKVIKDNVNYKEYTLISLPEASSEDPYRYFLEIWGKRPLDRNIHKKTEELFITCEQPCQTIGNPQWDVAFFAPKKVDNTWKVDNVTIYKLSH